jgi:hypothetical protein
MRFTYTSGQRPLDGYTLKRGIGRGGFGEVYYALSDGGKEVALKLVSQNADVELRGMRQCLNVKHPNLVALYDLRIDAQGNYWVVMEYVAGEALSAILDRNPNGVSPDLARQWFAGLASAVACLHEQGIVHRDLKPGNIFIENGIVKVGDYGLSKLIGGSQLAGQTQSIGTVHYMAPEISSGNYNRSIDIYAAGVILYEMLTGNVPFDGESAAEILMKHMTSSPDLSKAPGVFVPILDQALMKNPARRYRQIGEMAREVAATGEQPKPVVANALAAVPANSTSAVAPMRQEASAAPQRNVRQEVAELCVSLLKSTFFAALLTMVGAMLLQMHEFQDVARAFFLTIGCCWAVLIPAKLWTTAREDSWVRRAVLLGLGLLIGCEATWLAGYPLSAVWAGDSPDPEWWWTRGRLPDALRYLAYFGLAFFATRWWKLVERHRERRFSFAAVVAVAFWAYVLVNLIPGFSLPEPGIIALVSTAMIIQLVSPWELPAAPPSKRLRLRMPSEMSR